MIARRRWCLGRFGRWLPTAAVVSCCCLPATGLAANKEDPRLPEIEKVVVGFDGNYKLGRWAPIAVQLVGGTRPALGVLRVIVPDTDGDATAIATPGGRPTAVLPGQTLSVQLYAKIGRSLDRIRVEFDLLEPRESLEFEDENQPLPVASDRDFDLVVGGNRRLIGEPDLANTRHLPEQAVLADADGLPTEWYGYDALDTLVFVVGDGSKFQALRPDTAQFQALTQWLSMGGRLLLVAGPNSLAALEPGSGLAELAPGKVTGVVPVKNVESLETFAHASRRIPLSARGKAHGLQAARVENPQGVVVVEGAGLPLIVRTAHGFGEIVFFACDFNRAPLVDWKDRGKLIERLLTLDNHGVAPAEWPAHQANYGYGDLAGQMRGALDHFEGIHLVPFWVVGLAIVGYIVLIGPIDYLFVRRVLKRMELTWITFPIIVIAVSTAAYFAAGWAKGSWLRINQVDLVDVDAGSGLVRGTTWLNIFSPSSALYDLSLAPSGPAAAAKPAPPSPALPAGNMLFAWLGLPGLDWATAPATTPAGGWFRRPYVFAPGGDQLVGVPIDVWSTKSFVGHWQSQAHDLVSSDLSLDAAGGLTGRVTSRLPFKLRDCLLLYDRWAWSLSELPSGETEVPESGRRDLETVMRGFHKVKAGAEEGVAWQPVAYDPSSRDIDIILRQMMFYRAADAGSYTRMENDDQKFVDLSHELALGRAILVGTPDHKQPAAELHFGRPLETRSQHWVVYRFVLPVKPKP